METPREQLGFMDTIGDHESGRPIGRLNDTPGSMPPVTERQSLSSRTPAENKPHTIRSLTKAAALATLVGAVGMTAFLGLGKKDPDASSAQIAPTISTSANTNDENEPHMVTTPEELAKEIDRYNLHPTEADWKKPRMVYVKGNQDPIPVPELNYYFEALRLDAQPIVPSPYDEPSADASKRDAAVSNNPSDVSTSWEKLSSSQYNKLTERNNLIAIHIKNPAYTDAIRFYGYYRPTIVLKDEAKQTIYALYDSCVITPEKEDKNLTPDGARKLAEKIGKRGGVASFAVFDPKTGTKLRLSALQFSPCPKKDDSSDTEISANQTP